MFKIKLTIADQPLVLTPKEAAALFGLRRLREFSEGVWTPFVFCEPALPEGQDHVVRHFDLSAMTEEEQARFFTEILPSSSAFTFVDRVMRAATEEDVEA